MKNTLRILFAVVLALSMCVAGFALTLDTAETATEGAHHIQEIELFRKKCKMAPSTIVLYNRTFHNDGNALYLGYPTQKTPATCGY